MILKYNLVFTFADMFNHGYMHDQLYDTCYIITHDTRRNLTCELTMTIEEHMWDFSLSMLRK